jgi:3-isopropylmalate dehydrogenase
VDSSVSGYFPRLAGFLLFPGSGARERQFVRAEGTMSQYRIAWLPGDGIGKDVMEAARLVLDSVELDAEYVHGDIGWEFWRREGDALPTRTIHLLKTVDAALFGAVTSKPVKAAEAELAPELKGKGLTYRSPIVRMRQLFDLYVCLRPTKAYPGNPLNHKEGIDLVVFRENTEDLYSGVEFGPVPQELVTTLSKLSPPFAHFAQLPTDQYAVSCKINTRKGSERIVRAAFEFAKAHGRRKVTIVHKANVVRATDGLFLEEARRVAQDFPGIQVDDANIDAVCMWLVKNPLGYDVLVAPNLYGDIISDLCAQMVGGLGFGQHRRTAGRVRAHARLGAEVRGTAQGEPDRHDPGGEDDARLARRAREGRADRARRLGGDQGRSGPHLRHGRHRLHHRDGQGDRRRGRRDEAGRGRPPMSATDILVHEVGLRDGLQMEKRVVPTAQKIAWAEALLDSWVDILQLGSFVHPDKVPQMADTDRLFEHFSAPGRKPENVVLSGLVLNERGVERGLACGVDMFCMGVSASETHSRKNTGMGTEEANRRIIGMARTALAAGRRVQVSVQSAFGCGYEGPVHKERVVAIVRTFLDAGLRNLSLADTASHATPDQVEDLYSRVHALDEGAEWTCHFHNTYGLALTNCYAAYRAGVRSFESSVAGLGGCPFTKVAGGNTCTEDLVHALQRSGLRSDIQLSALIDVARDMSRFFGREMAGAVHKAGPIAAAPVLELSSATSEK